MRPTLRETGPSQQGPAPKAASTATNTPNLTRLSRQTRTYQYRIRFIRRGWVHQKHLYYWRRHDAMRTVHQLINTPTFNGEYEPVEWVRLDRREVVSKWEHVRRWEPEL